MRTAPTRILWSPSEPRQVPRGAQQALTAAPAELNQLRDELLALRRNAQAAAEEQQQLTEALQRQLRRADEAAAAPSEQAAAAAIEAERTIGGLRERLAEATALDASCIGLAPRSSTHNDSDLASLIGNGLSMMQCLEYGQVGISRILSVQQQSAAVGWEPTDQQSIKCQP